MSSLIRYIAKPHPVTGVTNAKLGTWCFLASEVMLFGGLFSAYIFLRTAVTDWPHGSQLLNVPLATLNTLILITSSVTMVMSWASLAMKEFPKFRLHMGLTVLLGLAFLVVKGFEYGYKFEHHHFPSENNFYAIYFTLTGLHGLHVIGGILVNLYFLFPGSALWQKDPDQFTGRIECAASAESRLHFRRALLAFRRLSLDLSFSGSLSPIGDPMEHSSKEEIRRHVKVYYAVFAALAVLTVVTVMVSYLHLAAALAILAALAIATVKGSLVASFFMHLAGEKKIIFWILLLTIVFFLVLLILPTIS
jgi:caa(3)-type oxidase subunit IV